MVLGRYFITRKTIPPAKKVRVTLIVKSERSLIHYSFHDYFDFSHIFASVSSLTRFFFTIRKIILKTCEHLFYSGFERIKLVRNTDQRSIIQRLRFETQHE